jgi:hypothetical protein
MNNVIVKGGQSIFTLKMGGPENTDQIIAALGFDFNELITQANFPLKPSDTTWEDDIEIIDPGCRFTEEEGLKFLADARLVRPTYEHGIRFGQQHGRAMTLREKPYIVFLHEAAWLAPSRFRRIVSLRCRTEVHTIYLSYTKLSLSYPADGFSEGCVLAGVRRRK